MIQSLLEVEMLFYIDLMPKYKKFSIQSCTNNPPVILDEVMYHSGWMDENSNFNYLKEFYFVHVEVTDIFEGFKKGVELIIKHLEDKEDYSNYISDVLEASRD